MSEKRKTLSEALAGHYADRPAIPDKSGWHLMADLDATCDRVEANPDLMDLLPTREQTRVKNRLVWRKNQSGNDEGGTAA